MAPRHRGAGRPDGNKAYWLKMIRCGSCTSEIPENSRFCLDCGEPVQSGQSVLTSARATMAMSGPQPPARQSAPSFSSSTPEFDEGRFLPGTLLADRYRIIGRLGKGGMGEVYRANDLRLGQTVALKFLPENMSQDPAILARFFNEVRIARQITHPNVCRVYDIGDMEGQPFISMQFIDGETLASLLLRIGRLPADKAIEITRRLCAGLAAAHTQGVLHRDLKPSNIMIDGRGQVLIMDFGLAGVAEQIQGAEIRSGTPAYMSPEQLAGRGVTVKSDLYALGLVMYEIFTGRRAFEAETLAELVRLREESRPLEISSVVRDVDPVIERVILKCLDADPANRPSSALAVSTALPGGDPLALALEAGETPSPEMVAASGSQEAVRPFWAVLGLAFCLAALALTIFDASRRSVTAMVNLDLPPEALASEARKTLQQIGYGDAPGDSTSGFAYRFAYLRYLKAHSKERPDWRRAANGQPPAIVFNYRASPDVFHAQNISGELGRVTLTDPPQTVPGMTTLTTDQAGRLIGFSAVPPRADKSATARALDPALLFTLAGLDLKAFQPDAFRATPTVPTDSVSAWNGTFPGRPDYPIHVDAAWWHGIPVFFRIVDVAAAETSGQPASPSAQQRVQQAINIGANALIVIVAPLFVWRNLRLGRGDKQGALRLAGFASVLTFAAWLLSAHHVADDWELVIFSGAAGVSLWTGAQIWLGYLALEPAVRRRWPRILVTWTRLLSGNWRDALVARDVLIGIVVGLGYDLVFDGFAAYVSWKGELPQPNIELGSLLGVRLASASVFQHLVEGLAFSLVFFLLFFVFRLIVRKEWLAGLLFVLLFALSRGIADSYPEAAIPTFCIVYGLIIAMLLRFGLLSLVTAIFVVDFVAGIAFTFNFSAWYGTGSLVAVLVVGGLSLVAFRQALGGRRLLAPLLDE